MLGRNITNVSEGLTKLVAHINELVPQFPPDFRTDAHKVDYLRKAETEFQDFALIPIQNMKSQGYSYKKFATTLHESIQNLRQILLLTGPSNVSRLYVTEGSDGTLTNMTRYPRSPRYVRCR